MAPWGDKERTVNSWIRTPPLVIVAAIALFASDSPQSPPKEARRAFDKATAALKAKQTDEAMRDFQQAVTLFPPYAEAWYQLGRLQFQQKQPVEARNSEQAAIRADPHYPAPYLMLAALEQSESHWKQLVDVTDALLRIDAIDYPEAWLLNAVGQYNSHNAQAAEKSAREAERLDSRETLPEIRRLLGLILAQRGDFAGEASQLEAYLKTVPSGPGSEVIRAHLADAVKRARGGTGINADSSATFRSETTLAVVRFQIHTGKNQTARQLLPQDIEVREDGVPQKIAVFEGGPGSPRTVPVEISLLFDCSSSVERITAASDRVFRDSLLDEFPNAAVAIYGFSDDLARLTRPTRDAATLKKAMDLVGAIPKHSTPLFGSIADTVRDAAGTGANVIRMTVIFSDGESESLGDENRAGELIRAAAESGTSLYPVILQSTGPMSTDAVNSIHDYLNLAPATGGREFHGLMGTDVLTTVLKSLAVELRSDYIAGFYVPVSGERKQHKVQVVLHTQVPVLKGQGQPDGQPNGKLYGGSRILIH